MELYDQLKMLISLEKRKVTDISRNTDVSYSSINSFLSGNSDIVSSALVRVLDELDIDLKGIIDKRIDQKRNNECHDEELGRMMATIYEGVSPVKKKIILKLFLEYADVLGEGVKFRNKEYLKQNITSL
ncbi:MAG: hypothetical protein CL677_00325 [Bdellovibrionaceae bacterium]|jgi:hypothetical protein|nr:hypothetical protein [Pseudobdellovibrionaceae bacterium]|tara:strand:- start:11669 stop:12055 length:387 start_codon:yes stop_codon:yes gene_type:complete